MQGLPSKGYIRARPAVEEECSPLSRGRCRRGKEAVTELTLCRPDMMELRSEPQPVCEPVGSASALLELLGQFDRPEHVHHALQVVCHYSEADLCACSVTSSK